MAGKLLEGTLEADSQQLLIGKLRSMGYMPIDIQQQNVPTMSRATCKMPFFGNRVKLKDVAVMSRQFATMINSGLALLRALNILAEQTESKPLAAIINQVRIDVEKGSSLSAALSRHPKAFSRLYVAMVRAGEVGGVLDSVLLRLAETIEKQVELRRKVRSAMTYPIVVMVLVLLIVTAMLLFIIPMFKGLYAELGGTLPLPDADAARHLVVRAQVLVPAVRRSSSASSGASAAGSRPSAAAKRWDTIKLRLPVMGLLVRKTALAPLLAHALGAGAVGCADPRVARHRRGDVGQPRREPRRARYAVRGQVG